MTNRVDLPQTLNTIFCGAFDNVTSISAPSDSDEDAPGTFREDGVVRNAKCTDGELSMYTSAGDSAKTLYETFLYGAKRNPQADCLGKRLDQDSPYEWKTYAQIQAEVSAVASYMAGTLKISPNDRVGMSGKNAPEYLTAIQACFWGGITTVPIYDTFGEVECEYIMKQTELKCIFVSVANLENIVEWSKGVPSLQKIIVWGSDTGKNKFGGDKVISFQDCVAKGKESLQEARPPSREDLAIVMYTSGTTGMPKGVMLTHTALVATLGSLERYFDEFNVRIDDADVFLSYLPLAHVFDFFSECLFLYFGAKIGYYRGDQKTLVDDIGALQPTIFVGVPRVFERIYKRVDSMVQGGSSVKKMLFNYFFEQKKNALAKGAKFDQASFLGDKLVFSKIKARLGGRVRIICSGGAPLLRHVEEWLKVAMCCPVVQGCGLTETCGASAAALPDRRDQLGTVGPPLFCLEVKLDPVPDMGYDGTAQGGGEICFRGPSVMKGYYNMPAATAEVLEKDGWFHTGDIGKFVSGGCMKIVDRKKQLFKLSQGEYVSPEKVEGIAAKSSLVGQIFVHGTSTEAFLVAVVVPTEEAFGNYGGREEAVKSDALKQSILKDLDDVCRSEKLKGYEIPKGVVLHSEEFTPESGFVTPSFKLKRPVLRKHFERDIIEVYASLQSKS